jgi:hypothetical protein
MFIDSKSIIHEILVPIFICISLCSFISSAKNYEVHFNSLNPEIIHYSENEKFPQTIKTSLLLLAARLEVLDRYLDLLESNKSMGSKMNPSRAYNFNRDAVQDQKLISFIKKSYQKIILQGISHPQLDSLNHLKDIDYIMDHVLDHLFKSTPEEKEIYKDILNSLCLDKGPYNEREISIMKYILKETFYPSILSAYDFVKKYKLGKDALVFIIMLY